MWRGRQMLADGDGEAGTWELWDQQWDRRVRARPRWFLQVGVGRDQTVGSMGKFLSDTQYVFALEPYTDGTPSPTVVTNCGSSFLLATTVTAHFLLATSWLFKNRGGQGIRWHHCCSCYGLLETDNRRQEMGSAGVNEDSAYFQPPPACLGEQEIGVWHRWVEDIQVLWAP